jgi:hypothetical protein
MFVSSASSSGPLNHGLSALLGQLGVSQPIAGVSYNNHGDSDDRAGPLGTTGSTASSNGLTGPSKAAISDQLLALFTGLQQQSSPQKMALPRTTQTFEPASNAASTTSNASSPIPALLTTFQRNAITAGSTTDLTV